VIRPTAAALALTLTLAGGGAAATGSEVDAAVDRGIAWLKSRQQADGSFPGRWAGEGYRTGETALALLTLLKGGVAPDDPAIARGFAWLEAQPLQRTYEVSVSILALEARFTPPPERSIRDEDPLASQIRKRFKRAAPARDQRWLQSAVSFLLRTQHDGGLWKYPGYGDPDLSNAQFAVLALAAAERMGLEVPKEPYLGIVAWLLDRQETSGPQVASFPVPAADRPIHGLHDRRAERLRRERERKRARRGGGSRTRAGGDPSDLETGTRQPMHARGWGYHASAGPRGSMTAAGLACLVVAKAALEAHPRYEEQLGPRVDRALRDGAAWLADRFRVDRHPGAEPDWLFYYLYTLERAGTLLAVDRFGPRRWYEEGADVILGHQQADGRITADTGGESDGELAGTCLALLFLKRSTVPVVERVQTGGDDGAKPAGGRAGAASGPTFAARPDGRVDVTLRLPAGPGRRAAVAGSWNGWDPAATPMTDAGEGRYAVTVTLAPGRYTYKFVVDGEWRPDPAAPASEPDGFGGENSVLEVPAG